MDAETMAEIEDNFGRIDWRVPMAQSLFWGWKGLAFADDREKLPCRRMVYVSLMEMTRRQGRLAGDPLAEGWTFAAAPNTALLESTLDFIEETMEEHRFNGIRYAYMGLLRDGMHIRAAEGRDADDLLSLALIPGLSTTATPDDYSGRGLGLTVVGEDVAILGGRITLDTAPGQSSQISLQVPLPR